MRKSIILAATAIVMMANSINISAEEKNSLCKPLKSVSYIISGSNACTTDTLAELFDQLGMNLENGTWMDCPIFLFPGINLPERETTGESETSIEADIPETEIPGTEFVTTESSSTEEVTTIEKPNIPETTRYEQSTTEKVTTKPEFATTEKNTTRPEPSTSEKATTKHEIATSENVGNLSYAQQVVRLVNKERVKAGLKEVTIDKNIEAAALVRAKETEISFSHTRPNGTSFSTVLKENGVSYRGAGENIAWGQSSPEEVMNGWMNSPGHRANILNEKFTKIGVGYYRSASGRNYWTQLFTY